MSVLWKKPIMDHLIWYKENVIRCCETGCWDGQPYRHIFPPDKTDLNFFDGHPPEARWLKAEGALPDEKITRTIGFDHMNSAWVMGLNLFPHLIGGEETEQALLASLGAQNMPFLFGQKIREAWFEEPVCDDVTTDLCMTTDDGKRLLIHLFYYNFVFGKEIPALFQAAGEQTHCIFVLLKQNTMLNPDNYLEAQIQEQPGREYLHVIYWEEWIPCLIRLLNGDVREYCKEFYRKSLDF